MPPHLTPRHQILLPAWREYRRLMRKALMLEIEARALDEADIAIQHEKERERIRRGLPPPIKQRNTWQRDRAYRLSVMVKDLRRRAADEFEAAVRKVGGAAATILPSSQVGRGMYVVLPRYRNTHYRERITFGTLSVDDKEEMKARLPVQVEAAQAALDALPPEVRQRLKLHT